MSRTTQDVTRPGSPGPAGRFRGGRASRPDWRRRPQIIIHQQTQVILCQIIFFPLYYTYYVAIISYYVSIISFFFFRVFGQLCHIMSIFRKQLLFQLFQYYYFNFFFRINYFYFIILCHYYFTYFLIKCIMSLISLT